MNPMRVVLRLMFQVLPIAFRWARKCEKRTILARLGVKFQVSIHESEDLYNCSFSGGESPVTPPESITYSQETFEFLNRKLRSCGGSEGHMIVRSRILSRSIFFMLFGCSLFPFSPSVSTRLHADDAAAEATSGNPKALKYFRVLQKRPSPG